MIKKWHLKAAVQKTISYLPGSSKLNYFFQRYVTKGVLLDDTHFGYKIQHAADHLDHFRAHGNPLNDQAVNVELGLGWYPVIPTIFYLTGQGKTISYDIYDWMKAETMIIAFNKILEWLDDGRLDSLFSNHPFIPERVAQLRTVVSSNKHSIPQHGPQDPARGSKTATKSQNSKGEHSIPQHGPQDPARGSKPSGNVWTRESLNKLIGLTPRIQDVRQSGLEENSVDYVCSNNTFEHVHAQILPGILAEFQRVLKPQAVSSHFIDMSDHFAHFDSSINVYNFLKYSEPQWKRIDNDIQPQNRMRLPSYLAIYSDLRIPVLTTHSRPGNLADLATVSLAMPYREMPAEEVAMTHAYVISTK